MLKGAKVQLWDLTGKTMLDTAIADEDGWYAMPKYVHRGKATDYLVKLLADTDASDGITYDALTLKTTIGGSDKWGEGFFFVKDLTPDFVGSSSGDLATIVGG